MQKDKIQKIARERIEKLFEMAKKEKNGRSKRYIQLARRIAEKHNVSLSKKMKMCFCKKCNTLFNSKTMRVRIQKKDMRITYTCLVCGNVQRWPYVKEKLKKGCL
jgi:ribonuclease P protein subunit RPR2